MEVDNDQNKLLENEEILLNNNRKKKYLIIAFAALIIIIILIIIIVAVSKNKENTNENKNSDEDKISSYKPTKIETVKLPEDIIYEDHAIYSKSGNIIFRYKKEKDNNTYIGLIKEDGSNLKILWQGIWKDYYPNKNGGIRLMPFSDNKRILTGDYVLECSPNLDNCDKSFLYPIIYPEEVLNFQGLYRVWSEIIISPDDHIGWTSLSLVIDSINFIGKLIKNENNYTITNVQIISNAGFIEYEDEKEKIFKNYKFFRGGEMKQFTNGGEALSLAGANRDNPLAKSVFQNLIGEEVYPLSNFNGYEETTMISPDGKLGLVMTTRFSPKTSSEIIGLIPRPFSILSISGINMFVYMYAVKGARELREGNIGPAVIDINESIKNLTYIGYDIHEEGWAFCSPISWHPNSKKAMFSEISRKDRIKRIRIVHFDDYIPGNILENKKTPDNIKYAKSLDILKKSYNKEFNGYFKGKEGILIINITNSVTESQYLNYSEDGETFYNGYEKFQNINQIIGKLESNFTVSGKNSGKMELNIAMNISGYIIYEEEGKKVTSGYAEYNGKKLTIENVYNKE